MAEQKDGPRGSSRGRGEGNSRPRKADGQPQQDGEMLRAPGRPGAGSAGRRQTPSPAATQEGDGAGGRSRGAPRSRQPDLQKELRDFASARPHGWNHEDWLTFLSSLEERGHNIGDREAIGLALEKERLNLTLSGVKGVGPQRRQALIERYGNVWNLRNADASEIASTASVPPSLAEEIKSRARGN